MMNREKFKYIISKIKDGTLSNYIDSQINLDKHKLKYNKHKKFRYPSDILVKNEVDIYKENLLASIKEEYQDFDWCPDSANNSEKAEAWENYGKNKTLNKVIRLLEKA